MNRHTARPHWVMSWLAPLALSAVYVLELWREGAFVDPVMLLTQVVFAAPLVIAGSVLLMVLEQEGRAHTLTSRLGSWLLWTPRALLLCFVAILALFSLDVFEAGRSAQQIAVGLLMHNLPALGLLGLTAIAWRWSWVGAVGLAAFAARWLSLFGGSGFLPSVFLLLVVLPLTLAVLYLLNWWLGGPERGKATQT